MRVKNQRVSSSASGFVGYVHEIVGPRGNDKIMVYLLCNTTTYGKLTELDAGDSKEPKETIGIWERTGCFYGLDYIKRVLDVTKFVPDKGQKAVVEKVKDLLKEKASVVLYLHGKPGTGKSMVGILMAKLLKGSFCKTWNPTDPGDTLSKVYTQVSPTAENPLVLVLDEFDIMLMKVHAGTIKPHEHTAIQIKDKVDWNGMLDDINLGMYPHLVLLLTSNKNPAFIRSLDESYIRDGRVDLIQEL